MGFQAGQKALKGVFRVRGLGTAADEPALPPQGEVAISSLLVPEAIAGRSLESKDRPALPPQAIAGHWGWKRSLSYCQANWLDASELVSFDELVSFG